MHWWQQAHNVGVYVVLSATMRIALDNKAGAVHYSYTWFFYPQAPTVSYYITERPQSQYHLKKKTKQKKQAQYNCIYLVRKRALASDLQNNNYIKDLTAGNLWKKDCSILFRWKKPQSKVYWREQTHNRYSEHVRAQRKVKHLLVNFSRKPRMELGCSGN